MNLGAKDQSPESGSLSQNTGLGRCWQTQTQNMAGVRTSIVGKNCGMEDGSQKECASIAEKNAGTSRSDHIKPIRASEFLPLSLQEEETSQC